MRNIKFLFVFVILANLSCYGEKSQSIVNRSFFNFTLSDNQLDVLSKLDNYKSKIEIIEDKKYRFVTIAPENQILSEQENLDFSIGLFKDKILSMIFYNRDKDLFEELLEISDIDPIVSNNETEDKYEWNIGTISITCWIETGSAFVTYQIFNEEVSDDYDVFVDEIMGDDPFF